MSFDYALISGLNLHVQGRIEAEDAARQTVTATEILSRLKSRPGVVLADEVGMGKTFVALAVAASVAHADRRPVVVMVPPSVKDKWPRDFGVFRERCVEPQVGRLLRYRSASNGLELLKLLDDPPERRVALIFLTHGAMSTRLGDTWVKLAIIQRAVKHRKNIDKLREAISRFAGELLRARWYAPDVWSWMLRSHPESWAQILVQLKEPEQAEDIALDDPVPRAILDALEQVDLEEVFVALQGIPQRDSANFKQRMSLVRGEVEKAVKGVWEKCIHLHKSRLPLLILDEAHHLKNPSTQLSSLFDSVEAEEDAKQLSGGPLASVFERMLFLTATPFQLGHHELCNVLQRFGGVAWTGRTAPVGGRITFEQEMRSLRAQLDSAQQAALQLDYAWGKLGPEDLVIDGEQYEDVGAWWKALSLGSPEGAKVVRALDRFKFAQGELRSAELALRPWVIRHSRPLSLPGQPQIPRRRRIVGAGIRKFEDGYRDLLEPGLELGQGNALPFLLAARLVSLTPETRPVFAEGLASSYEAFLETRARRQAEAGSAEVDDDVLPTAVAKLDGAASWYLEQTTEAVQFRGRTGDDMHPKVSATVERAMALWGRGEKVLIFCHYIATGRALRAELSKRMRREIQELATKKIRCRQAEAEKELDRVGRRFDRGSPAANACLQEAGRVLADFSALAPHRLQIEDILLRFIRTPSFLVRYFGLTEGTTSGRAFSRAFAERDGSGISIVQVVRDLFDFLATRCSTEERDAYIEAVDSIQTGSHIGGDAVRGAAEDELTDVPSESFVANVRLINGRTRADTRHRLMLAFNTPFYPEILIASSVMAEGVDLHLNCRHVIHHDLSWNPSVLEQRTGRVDRIGARAERAGQPINVFFPYVAETQDEKMYRVVMDRERWFQVVMGANQRIAALATAGGADQIASRVPLPPAALAELVFRLGL